MDNYFSRRIITAAFFMLIGLFLFGFQSGRVESEQGNYIVSIEFPASPVKTGTNTMRLIVYERGTKEPVSKKLELEVIPWMPTNVHAVNEVPIVKEKGKGEYLIEKVNFGVAGDWEVYVKIKSGSREDSAVFDVNVIEQ